MKNTKTARMKFALEPELKAKLEKAAASMGMTSSAYMRFLLGLSVNEELGKSIDSLLFSRGSKKR